VRVIQPGGDHQTRILSLDARDQVLATLGEWLGMHITAPAAQGIVVPPLRVDPALRVGPPVGALAPF